MRRGDYRALTIHRVADCVYHSPDQCGAYRNGDDALRAPNGGAFPNARIRTQDHGAHVVFLEVERHSADEVSVRVGHRIALRIQEFQHLADHAFLQSVDTRNSVAHLEDRAYAHLLDALLHGLQFSGEDGGYFFGSNCHCADSVYLRRGLRFALLLDLDLNVFLCRAIRHLSCSISSRMRSKVPRTVPSITVSRSLTTAPPIIPASTVT